jgi:hypothetical protein
MDITAISIRVHKSNQSTMANRRRLYHYNEGFAASANITIDQYTQ